MTVLCEGSLLNLSVLRILDVSEEEERITYHIIEY